jgi:hypothetical protein
MAGGERDTGFHLAVVLQRRLCANGTRGCGFGVLHGASFIKLSLEVIETPRTCRYPLVKASRVRYKPGHSAEFDVSLRLVRAENLSLFGALILFRRLTFAQVPAPR